MSDCLPISRTPPCYEKMYSSSARECQICKLFSGCLQNAPNPKTIRNPVSICIVAFIRKRGSVSASEIDKHLKKSFRGTSVNTYNWMSILKNEGVVSLKNVGRKRIYSLR